MASILSLPHPRPTLLLKLIPDSTGRNISDSRSYTSYSCRLRLVSVSLRQGFLVRASGDSIDEEHSKDVARDELERSGFDPGRAISSLRASISSLPPPISVMRGINSKFAFGFCFTLAFVAIAVRQIVLRNRSHRHRGSVADLVRRGQLKSDRRGISNPLRYEDPFNNPLVKVSKSNSTVEICGKVYRMAPVTLTKEQQTIHQKRRSRAYQWKRPTIFLKEGDEIPPDIDPDTIGWIPANHPFATTVSDIDEDLAQSNIYQKDGVPFRIKAEHEAMQRKLEQLQSEQKLNNVIVTPSNLHDLERPFKSPVKSKEHQGLNLSTNQQHGNITSKVDREFKSSDNDTSSDELNKS